MRLLRKVWFRFVIPLWRHLRGHWEVRVVERGKERIKPGDFYPSKNLVFDELVVAGYSAHFEMMNDNHLWIGFDRGNKTNHVNVWVEKGKLKIRVEEDV